MKPQPTVLVAARKDDPRHREIPGSEERPCAECGAIVLASPAGLRIPTVKKILCLSCMSDSIVDMDIVPRTKDQNEELLALGHKPEVIVRRVDRALTLWQPWAWLVALGHKPLENRPDHGIDKSYRGPFWIHAGKRSKKRVEEEWPKARAKCDEILGKDFRLPEPDEMTFGAIIGRAFIVDCYPPSGHILFRPGIPWHIPDQHGLVVAQPEVLTRPVLCLGLLGFWPVSAALESELAKSYASQP
jgi:hypothetical protein